MERMELITDQLIRLQEEEGENAVMMTTSASGQSFEGVDDRSVVGMQRMKDWADAQARIRDDLVRGKAELRDVLEMVHKELVRTKNAESTVQWSVRDLNIPSAVVGSLEMKKKVGRGNACFSTMKDGKVLIEEVIPVGSGLESSSESRNGSVRGDDIAAIPESESLGWHLLRMMGLCDASLSLSGRVRCQDVLNEDDMSPEDEAITERLKSLMPWTDVDADSTNEMLMDIQRVLIVCNHVDSLSQLVDSVLPQLLGDVCQVVTANVRFHRNQKHTTRMESYRGPSGSARAACAAQLVWTLQTCSLSDLYDDELEMIGKTVLDGSNDASYIVRNICMAAAEICVVDMPDEKRVKMRFLSKYIVPLVRASVEANDPQCWMQTYHVASAVLKRCPDLLPDVMPVVVEQLCRNQERLEYAVNWVAAMKSCFLPVSISLIEYSSSILPILLEWIQSHDANLQQRALNALSLYLRACWPRNKCHAHVIWSALEQVFERQGGADKMSSDVDIMKHLKECCRVLWVTAGKEFRNVKRESPTCLVAYVSQMYDDA